MPQRPRASSPGWRGRRRSQHRGTPPGHRPRAPRRPALCRRVVQPMRPSHPAATGSVLISRSPGGPATSQIDSPGTISSLGNRAQANQKPCEGGSSSALARRMRRQLYAARLGTSRRAGLAITGCVASSKARVDEPNLRQLDRTDDARAVARPRVDREVTAGGLDAVIHVAQSASVLIPEREPGPIVADLEAQTAACLGDRDRESGGTAGVLECVLQRLDAGEVDGALDLDRVVRPPWPSQRPRRKPPCLLPPAAPPALPVRLRSGVQDLSCVADRHRGVPGNYPGLHARPCAYEMADAK